VIEILLENFVDAHETLFSLILDYLRNYVFVKFLLIEGFIVKHLLVFEIKLEWCAVLLLLYDLTYLYSILILKCFYQQLLLITTRKMLLKLFFGCAWADNLLWLSNALETVLITDDAFMIWAFGSRRAAS